MVITAIVLWIVGLTFILLTLKNILVRTFKRQRCSALVKGTVTEVQERARRTGRSSGHAGYTLREYIPSVSYTVGGVDYETNLAPAYAPDAYQPGMTVDIQYNPKKPSEINKKGSSNKADLVMLGIGVALLVAGAVLLFIEYR